MHQLVPAEMQEQHNLSSSMTDQCFRVWLTLPPMPNTLCHWDPNDFGISEDYREWAYIMHLKWGSLRENKRRVHGILRFPAGICSCFGAWCSWKCSHRTCPRQCWRKRCCLCGIWWSIASCPRWWGCIASVSRQPTRVLCADQRIYWRNPLWSMRVAWTSGQGTVRG